MNPYHPYIALSVWELRALVAATKTARRYALKRADQKLKGKEREQKLAKLTAHYDMLLSKLEDALDFKQGRRDGAYAHSTLGAH